MKKGFTLIELLAVIVILAIIALIAVPIVINIINGARESSIEISAENYIEAARISVVRKNLTQELGDTTCLIQETGDMLCDNIEVKVDMDGMKATGGKIVFEQGKVVLVEDLLLSGRYYNTDNGNLISSDTPQTETHNYVYRWTTDHLQVGDSIVGISTTTDYTTLGKNYFLRHDLNSDNTIKTSETCFVLNSTLYCLIGDEQEYTNNLAVMHQANSSCNDDSCTISDFNVQALSDGYANVKYDNKCCRTNEYGYSYCGACSHSGGSN